MFEEYDVVKSKRQIDHIPKGTLGTIVMVYGKREYEVEFVDDDGESLAVVTLSQEDIVRAQMVIKIPLCKTQRDFLIPKIKFTF